MKMLNVFLPFLCHFFYAMSVLNDSVIGTQLLLIDISSNLIINLMKVVID